MNHPATSLLLLTLASPLAAQWHLDTPATSPAARRFPAMTYDLANGQTVLFGGARTTTPIGALGDTWTFDGATWTEHFPATAPSARSGSAMVYDLARNRCVLYGGVSSAQIGGSSSSDTWEWDGSTWTQVFTPTTAGARGRFGAAYDVARNRTVVYGGIASSLLVGALNTTYEYDGTTWTQRTPANNPGPLQDPAMCYDLVHQRVVLFGGANPLTGTTANTWLFDGTNWTPAVGAQPPGRTQAQLFWDNTRNLVVLHGGSSAAGASLADTWTFDGTTWRELHGAAPTAHRAFGCAFDLARSSGVVFGGIAGGGETNETWEYDGATVEAFGSGCLGSSGVPVLSATAGPRLGQPFVSTLSGLLTVMPIAAVVSGTSSTSYLGVPLPADATPIGITGCTIYTSLDIVDLVTAVSGTAVHSLAIPASTAFFGIPFFQQGASLDPALNPFGAALSNALAAVVGN